jgi:hypothetical protein
MATLIDRIESLSGTVADHTDADIWLTDGANDVIRRIQRMNPSMLHQCAVATAVTSSGLALTGSDIVVDVHRGSFASHEIAASDRYKAGLSTSLFYVTERNPVHYRRGGTLYILPAPGVVSSEADVVTPPTVLHSDSAITHFPSEMVYLTTLYAAMENTIAQMSTALATTVPTAPTLQDVSVTLPTAPTYTKPTESLFGTAYGVVTTHLDTDEDPELAGVKLGQVDAALKKWATDIQDELNEFSKENAVFQATIQKLLEEARLNLTEDQIAVSKYAHQVDSYSAQLTSKIGSLRAQYDILATQYATGFAVYAPATASRRSA